MRIALVHRTFSSTGGTERFGLDLARTLLEAGDEVHLVGDRLEAPLEGALFHRATLLSAGRTVKLLSFLRSSAAVLRRLERTTGRFDAILGLGRTLDQDVLRLGGGSHAHYLEAVEGWHQGRPPSLLRLDPYHRLVLELERRQLSLTRTRRIIAVSHRVRAELLERFPRAAEAITVIHNGVDLERFNPDRLAPSRLEQRAAFGLEPQALVVLFVGNGLERKGYPAVLEAFAGFAAAARTRGFRPPLRLLVVGQDAARKRDWIRPYLEPLAAFDARIVLAGFQPAVERCFAAADLLVLPTRYEPFGNVCLEAMAMGLPVVTTRLNGVSELLGGEAASLILERPGDIDAQVQVLLSLLEPSRRVRLGALSRAIAARHPITRNAREVRAVLAEVTASSETGRIHAGHPAKYRP